MHYICRQTDSIQPKSVIRLWSGLRQGKLGSKTPAEVGKMPEELCFIRKKNL